MRMEFLEDMEQVVQRTLVTQNFDLLFCRRGLQLERL